MTPLFRAKTAAQGLDRQEGLADGLAGGAKIVFAWVSPRGLITGRSDSRLPEFDRAAERLAAEGWPVLVRRSGGSACPVSPGTLQIALARPAPGMTIDLAYLELAGLIGRLVGSCGLETAVGEMPASFCPGRYDMSVGGRKIVGMSQHWRQAKGAPTVTTAATLIVDDDPGELSRIVDLFYATGGSGKRCAPETVGSLAAALPSGAPRGEALIEDLCGRLSTIVEEGGWGEPPG